MAINILPRKNVAKEVKKELSPEDCRLLTAQEKKDLDKAVEMANSELEKIKKSHSRKLSKDEKKDIKEKIELQKVKLKEAKDIKAEMLKQDRKRANYERAVTNAFYSRWVQVMAYMGLSNKTSQTYALRNLKLTTYGFSANIHSPLGMNVTELQSDSNVATIQKNLKCLFVTNDVPKSNHIEVKFILKDVGYSDFKPIKLCPYEVLLSQCIDGSPMTSNMLKYPHILIQGGTNMGKTKFIDIILTNLITTRDPEEVSLYIVQADKSDQYPYSGCKHCRGYSDTIEDTVAMLSMITEIVESRNREMKTYNYDGIANNIHEYNYAVDKKILKGKKRWNYMYLVIDEYASLMPDNSPDKKIKQLIQSMMERIIQIGRSVGLYCVLSTQRATIDKLPSFVKANCCTIVTFKVNNRKSSEIALDSGEAVGLKQREFITKIETMMFGQTYNLSQRQIIDYIKPFRYSQVPKFGFQVSEKVKEMMEENDKNNGGHKRTTKSQRNKKLKELEALAKASDEQEKKELQELADKKSKDNKVEEIVNENDSSLKIKKKKEKVKVN